MLVDTTYDFRTDARGKDPDSHSPTLRRYHQVLWGRTLPNGRPFALDVNTRWTYLHHRSELGEFWLASDTMINSYSHWPRLHPILNAFSEAEVAEFDRSAYTIGGMIVFPGQKVGGKMTINGARGFNPSIRDRMDLTLECIRRHFLGQPNPLEETLARYDDFFGLFGGFSGYVEHFLLGDLVTADLAGIRFFLPFDEFATSPVPADLDTYREFRRRCLEFIALRNHRIDVLARSLDAVEGGEGSQSR